MAAKVVGDFDVRTPGADALARKLSGRQSCRNSWSDARSCAAPDSSSSISRPGALMPGAARVIRQALIDLAAQGAAVLVISQDLDELFAIADRMAVIHEGHVSRLRPTGEWTREAVGLEMMGVAPQDAH